MKVGANRIGEIKLIVRSIMWLDKKLKVRKYQISNIDFFLLIFDVTAISLSVIEVVG